MAEVFWQYTSKRLRVSAASAARYVSDRVVDMKLLQQVLPRIITWSHSVGNCLLCAMRRSVVRPRMARSYSGREDKNYRISGPLRAYDAILPYNHALPRYQQLFKQYDRKIALVASVVYRLKGGQCVDIGANVGDTALSIRATTDMPIVCIEGDDAYFLYLQRNTLGKEGIRLVKCFVGRRTDALEASLVRTSGTGKIKLDEGQTSQMTIFALNEVLQKEGIAPNDITLLKIDTDGFDFDILLGSQAFLEMHKPSVFFEYEIGSGEAWHKALEVIEIMSRVGYKFIVYDNYGNFMAVVNADCVRRFSDLNLYITSSARNGGGICYADVFASTDDEVICTLHLLEQETTLG